MHKLYYSQIHSIQCLEDDNLNDCEIGSDNIEHAILSNRVTRPTPAEWTNVDTMPEPESRPERLITERLTLVSVSR